jgi:hypothetical protein
VHKGPRYGIWSVRSESRRTEESKNRGTWESWIQGGCARQLWDVVEGQKGESRDYKRFSALGLQGPPPYLLAPILGLRCEGQRTMIFEKWVVGGRGNLPATNRPISQSGNDHGPMVTDRESSHSSGWCCWQHRRRRWAGLT